MSNRVRPRKAKIRPPRRRWELPSIPLLSGRPRWTVFGILAFILAGAATWALWPDSAPRQREYLDATACLLTDEKGVTGEPARPVWTAMRDASVSSLVKVQYLPVNGPQTTDNARAHLASLAGSRCGVVIAVGTAQVDAVVDAAPTFPTVRFVTVGGGAPSANVSVVDDGSPEDLRNAIRQRVTTLAADPT